MIENKKVTVVETNRLPLSTNGHFLMFLKRTPGAGRRYKLFGSTAGFFEVRKDRTVRSMIKGYSSEEVSGVRLEDIVGRIRTPHIK
jgi:hypothetical protein